MRIEGKERPLCLHLRFPVCFTCQRFEGRTSALVQRWNHSAVCLNGVLLLDSIWSSQHFKVFDFPFQFQGQKYEPPNKLSSWRQVELSSSGWKRNFPRKGRSRLRLWVMQRCRCRPFSASASARNRRSLRQRMRESCMSMNVGDGKEPRDRRSRPSRSCRCGARPPWFSGTRDCRSGWCWCFSGASVSTPAPLRTPAEP